MREGPGNVGPLPAATSPVSGPDRVFTPPTKAQFDCALEHRTIIGQAEGILIERFKLTGAEAFQRLSLVSQNTRTKLFLIAEALVNTGEWPGEDGDDALSSRTGRIRAAVERGDQRDAAGAARSAASRARHEAADLRDDAAEAREAAGDFAGAAEDRRLAMHDRMRSDLDMIWAGRDSDQAASDRALLAEGCESDR